MALARVSAYVAAAFVAAVTGVGVVFAVFAVERGEFRPALTLAVAAVVSVVAVALGVLIATREPDNVVGLLLVLAGALPVGAATGHLRDRVYPDAGPVELSLTAGTWMLFYLLPALLLLYFPDGRAVAPRWRWVGPTLVLVVVLFNVAAALDPAPFPAPYQDVSHPFRVPEKVSLLMGGVGAGLLPIFLGLLVAAVFSLLVRYHRSPGDVRAQLKWLALGAAFLPGSLLLAWASYLLVGDGQVILVGFVLTCLAVPVAIAIAFLRPDLVDVARVIAATITYGLIVAAVLACSTVVSFVVALISGLGAGRVSPVVAALAAALAAVLVAPLRSRLQRRVDRKVYPTRRAVLAAVEQLQAQTDLGEAQPEHLERVLQAALHDPQLRVGYRVPGLSGLVAADGSPLEATGVSVVPVALAGQEVGAIVRGQVGTPALLREIAAASALLVEVVRLRIERTQALEAAEASRSRLLHASLEKHRRLEQDLQDGAGQRLQSIGAALRLARRRLRDDESVDGLLEKAVAEVGTAAAEVRQVAQDLRPSSLDGALQEGLDHALAALASQVPVPVTLEVEVTDLPDSVAATAYQVANEAMANAVRHASPAAIGVQVRQADGVVTVQVRDDGSGGATIRPGAGLAGLAERVAAVGGALRLTSARGLGTTVEAVLPC